MRQRHAAQLARYEAIQRLRAAEAGITHIARTVGVSRETVYRYLRLPGPPVLMRLPARRAALDPHVPYLEQRWAEGCHNGKRLWREIRERGFATALPGDLDAVRAGLSERRSNGLTEGFIHQLKLLKRQGYGRAGFDLLRRRVLCAA